jgi:Tat protein secretion system quality control protein TatD with DNase activity
MCTHNDTINLWFQEFEKSGDPDKHLQELLKLAKEGAARGKVVAIGECGLDYDRVQFCPPDIQRQYFEKQFAIAEATRLPLFLHMRAAADDFIDIMSHNQHRFHAGVVHSFTGTAKERDQLLAFPNIYIGEHILFTLQFMEALSICSGHLQLTTMLRPCLVYNCRVVQGLGFRLLWLFLQYIA